MPIRAKIKWLAAVASAIVAAPVTAQDRIALIYHVDGRVMRASPGEEPVQARMGDDLADGDRLEVMEQSAAHLFYASGVQRTITKSLTIRANELPARGAMPDGFERRFRTLSRPSPPLGGSRGGVRPAPGQPRMLEPADGTNAVGPDVTFRWTAPETAAAMDSVADDPAYRPPLVFRIRADDDRDWTTFEVDGVGPWQLPAAYRLNPGVVYRWAVTTQDYHDAPIAARFRVLTEEELAPLARIREVLGSSGVDPESKGSLLLALAYDELGLPSEQLRALRRLETGNEGELGPWFYLLRARAHQALGNMQEALDDARRARELRP